MQTSFPSWGSWVRVPFTAHSRLHPISSQKPRKPHENKVNGALFMLHPENIFCNRKQKKAAFSYICYAQCYAQNPFLKVPEYRFNLINSLEYEKSNSKTDPR